MSYKKGAMFGLEGRALKKESGRLFLASLRRLTFRLVAGQQASYHVNDQDIIRHNLITNKKGAMFGLDARIALAIFGALSVISGASLYSAIQDSKATAMYTEMQEIGKAWEQYLLDTGQDLTRTTTSIIRNMEGLVRDNGVNGWNGPYLAYDTNEVIDSAPATDVRLYKNGYRYLLHSVKDTQWGEGSSAWVDESCSATDACYNWVMILAVDNLDLIKAIDDKYDNSTGSSLGNVRWYYVDDVFKYRMSIKYALFGNPPAA